MHQAIKAQGLISIPYNDKLGTPTLCEAYKNGLLGTPRFFMTFCRLLVVCRTGARGQGDVVALMGGDRAPCTAEVLRFEVEDAPGKVVCDVAVAM